MITSSSFHQDHKTATTTSHYYNYDHQSLNYAQSLQSFWFLNECIEDWKTKNNNNHHHQNGSKNKNKEGTTAVTNPPPPKDTEKVISYKNQLEVLLGKRDDARKLPNKSQFKEVELKIRQVKLLLREAQQDAYRQQQATIKMKCINSAIELMERRDNEVLRILNEARNEIMFKRTFKCLQSLAMDIIRREEEEEALAREVAYLGRKMNELKDELKYQQENSQSVTLEGEIKKLKDDRFRYLLCDDYASNNNQDETQSLVKERRKYIEQRDELMNKERVLKKDVDELDVRLSDEKTVHSQKLKQLNEDLLEIESNIIKVKENKTEVKITLEENLKSTKIQRDTNLSELLDKRRRRHDEIALEQARVTARKSESERRKKLLLQKENEEIAAILLQRYVKRFIKRSKTKKVTSKKKKKDKKKK